METGVIKFFDSRDNKRFGFVTMKGKEEIFFHFNDGENIKAGKSEPVFSDGKLKREPKKGDLVMFYISLGYKGPKATPWGFADDYERAKKEIAARPAPATYRVLQQTTVYGNPPNEKEILWEGSDITKLCAKYPRPNDRRMDDLSPNFSCNDFSQKIWFECQTKNGWEHTSDPRPVEPVGYEQLRRW
jgi:hypothetical protein